MFPKDGTFHINVYSSQEIMKKKDKKLNARKEADKMLKGVIQDMNTQVLSTLKQKLKK